MKIRCNLRLSIMSRHNPEFYSQYRPYYPAETFEGFQESLLDQGAAKPFAVADIGCGTGHSAVSLLRAGVLAQIIGIDPDPEMIARAKVMVENTDQRLSFRLGSGEETGLDSQSLDGITVGSALHWMDPARTGNEFKRILRPKGVVRIFEYQFPKAVSHPVLNEWIRRQFNLHWKAPHQEPRGNFKELTAVFRTDPEFRLKGEMRPQMVLPLTAAELTGLILSQSRVLHFEDGLTAGEKQSFRGAVLEKLTFEMKAGVRHDFDFKLAWVEFLKIS